MDVRSLTAGLLTLCLAACSGSDSELKPTPQNSLMGFTLSNTDQIDRTEQSFIVPLALEHLSNAGKSDLVVFNKNKEIPSQLLDQNQDGKFDALLINSQISANQKATFWVAPNSEANKSSYTNRAHAEISINKGGKLVDGKMKGGEFESVSKQKMPAGHVPGDMMFRFEGPGWESDKIAYRLYFDHRNVIDIFGKKVPDIVLPEVGQIGYSYHKPAPWGLDILKVGPSLGIGGLGMMVDSKVNRVSTAESMEANILEKGPLRALVQINHENWRIAGQSFNLSSNYSITAGSKLTHNEVKISPTANNLVTGIVKHEGTALLKSDSEGDWAYIATYGKQSYLKDELGMAVFYKNSSLVELTEDKHNQLVVMKPEQGELDYYFLGSWAQDSDAIKTQKGFSQYLEQVLYQLNNPIELAIINP